MDFSNMQENLMELIQDYRSFGPIPGLVLPIIEAFLPFLPLFVFVTANASAFGLGWGFLFSWIGACTGALIVFSIVRKYGQKRFLAFLKNHKQVKRLVDWVDRHGFGPLFLLMCFPFTPSAVVNIVAGLSRISIYQYGVAVLAGKMVMIFSISYIGHDIPSLIHNPKKTIILGIVIVILWYIGKRIEAHLDKKIESDRISNLKSKEKGEQDE
ncbi:MAG: TVP38/TMEM64 family protein [Caldibacillus thermoamylovorans]|uniref:TVP38/TMEM64 family protein n=1 Tax=Bacillaceae TaxID=186817 RepID=UPI001D07A97F|nr:MULTISPECIES: TVP38/TMEM64 family protein [Bacillaceae]MCB7069444.1 TVP38/TMEM64 family protein [Caldibacillus sp. 210928-DFI.2.22]MCB7072865.1 TVP38/TMEM64 family protein [Caldibacillus sp. 210928-DFI.2.18]MCM3797397.1 TVP38/TMEM64 family protein [Caldibacillus thermoamylovorans]MED3643498.1 TVP38/TMEM64 family protein [Caldifermentibacillus hisashii]